MECSIKKKADPTPKNKKTLFFTLSLLICIINLLFKIQYLINNSDVIIIPGLNKR